MFVSTRGRYALQVMLDLAMQSEEDGYTPMKDVAERQGISLKYLEKILPVLVKNELITGVHGKSGGYKLTRTPAEYPVGEILRLTEGDLAPVTCLEEGKEPCQNSACCMTYPMWHKLNGMINNYLDGVTVADLLEGRC